MGQERSFTTVLLIILLLGFTFLVIQNAWLGDDSYITLRTVENFINGYGLVWNIAERVQAYTHPLWMFVLSAVYFVIRDIYFATVGASIGVSILTLWLVMRYLAKSELTLIAAVITLCLSKAYVEYATSGLENPLTHLLLVLFFIYFFQEQMTHRRFFMLALFSSLLSLNRMDALLLCLPALCFAWWEVKSWRAIQLLFVAFLPFIAWELFASFYYGFPFPNTAYAKLNTNIEQIELWKQGFAYFSNTLYYDPITLFGVTLGCVLAFWSRQWKPLLVAVGIMLYLVYIGRIGGDFMRGRFFTAPLLCAMIVVAQLDFGRVQFPKAALSVGSYIATLILLALMTNALVINNRGGSGGGFDRGIADERIFYYSKTGLLNMERYERQRRQGLIKGMDLTYVTETCGGLGQYGFVSGPQYVIVDNCGLADPLIARLPALYNPAWRVGHYERTIPTGYLGSLRTGENLFEDKAVGEYYQKLALITRGPLFDWERLKTIIAFNRGEFEHLVDRERYMFPPEIMQSYQYADLPTMQLPLSLGNGGVKLNFEQPQHATTLDLSLNSDLFQVSYFLEKKIVAEQKVQIRFAKLGQQSVHWVAVPQEAQEQGFDQIHLLPLRPNTTDGVNKFGGLSLLSADSAQWPFNSVVHAYIFAYWRQHHDAQLDSLREQIVQAPTASWAVIPLEQKLDLLDTGDPMIHAAVIQQLNPVVLEDTAGDAHLRLLGAYLFPEPPPATSAIANKEEENKVEDSCKASTPVAEGIPYQLTIHFEGLHSFYNTLPTAILQVKMGDDSFVSYQCTIIANEILDIGLISSPLLTLTLPKNYNTDNGFELGFRYNHSDLVTKQNGQTIPSISFR